MIGDRYSSETARAIEASLLGLLLGFALSLLGRHRSGAERAA
jgi:hypothetical protein